MVGLLMLNSVLYGQQKIEQSDIVNSAAVFEKNVIYDAQADPDYYIFRIASMVCTKKGSLLAFVSARKDDGGDLDPINIVMRRSTDNGKTWGPMKLIAGGESVAHDNATPIVDQQTGDIHLVYQVRYKKCYYIKSTDDGQSWSEPRDITGTIDEYKKFYEWKFMAPGPGHGIQMTNGRIVVPFWMSDRGGRPSIVVSVYSDDHGETWQAGEVALPNNDVSVVPNETSVIQLADGRVMFNARNESINYRRLVTYSDDGATNWSEPVYHDAFFESICFGSMARYSLKPEQSKNRILFCNPDSRHNPWVAERAYYPNSARARLRSNLTVRMSYDEGETWPVRKVIDPEISAYSDIAVTPDGTIHILYEAGSLRGDDHFKSAEMSVVSFNLEWLTDGEDTTEL